MLIKKKAPLLAALLAFCFGGIALWLIPAHFAPKSRITGKQAYPEQGAYYLYLNNEQTNGVWVNRRYFEHHRVGDSIPVLNLGPMPLSGAIRTRCFDPFCGPHWF